MMDNFFDRKTEIDGSLIYEKQNIISVVNPINDLKYPQYTYRLHISLWKLLDRKEIPKFILQYVGNPGSNYSGLFYEVGKEKREASKQETLTNSTNFVNNNEDWDEIPF